MKTFWRCLGKAIAYPIVLVVSIAVQFWWLYLILLGVGAYQTAAKAWGPLAGIISLVLAFALPIASFSLWGLTLEETPKDKEERGGGGKYSRARRQRAQHDRGEDDSAEEEKRQREIKRQQTYLRLLSSLIALVSKADGHVDDSEIQMAELWFQKLELSSAQREVCIQAFRDALKAGYTVEYYAAQIIALEYTYEMRAVAYEVLWDIACADSVLSAPEESMLRLLSDLLKLAPGLYERYYYSRTHRSRTEGSSGGGSQSHRDPLENEYDELGCSSSASNEELKTSYRNLAKRLHPDVLRAQGLPESLMGRANERMARINAAWEKIKRSRGL